MQHTRYRLASAIVLGLAYGWSQSPTFPDTPAGRTLRAWLDAFNSGDKAKIQAFTAKYQLAKPADDSIAFHDQTGGFDLLSIEKSGRLSVQFQIKEKAEPTTWLGKIDVNDGDPATFANFDLRPIPQGLTAADMNLKIDAAERARLIEGAIVNMREYYVYPELASKMADALRARQRTGDYNSIDDANTFAERLTGDLRAVSHDMHLRIVFSARALPKGDEPSPNPAAELQERIQMEHSNCEFEKVERLPSNIGYVKFDGFDDAEVCGPTAAAAMNFLGNVEAIIFDLRNNGGGDPKMVAFIASYLFDKSVHLNDLYDRKEDSTTQFWTLPYVPGKRLAGKPAFVLTANYTFSAAEEFAYDLKNLKRATIVGETTAGGAHPISERRIDDHFMIVVPSQRAVNPISKTDWEGTGVEPDVKVPADQALNVAKRMAADQIRKSQGKRE